MYFFSFYQVKYNQVNNEIECTCKLFLRLGIQCRHVFFAFNHCDITTLPRRWVLTRWMKNAERMISTKNSTYASQFVGENDTVNSTLNEIWLDFQRCVSVAGLDKQKLDIIKNHVRNLKDSLFDGHQLPGTSNKNEIIESLVGAQPTDEVVIQVPIESRNKGCGKRIMSGAEKSIIDQKKRLRTCKTCHSICNHDSRNCPSNKK